MLAMVGTLPSIQSSILAAVTSRMTRQAPSVVRCYRLPGSLLAEISLPS